MLSFDTGATESPVMTYSALVVHPPFDVLMVILSTAE